VSEEDSNQRHVFQCRLHTLTAGCLFCELQLRIRLGTSYELLADRTGAKRSNSDARRTVFDPQREASFGSYQNLLHVAKKLQGVQPSEVKPWLEQDAYTLHRPVRKRSPRNPYTVSNLMYV